MAGGRNANQGTSPLAARRGVERIAAWKRATTTKKDCSPEASAQEYPAYGCSCYRLTRFTDPPCEGHCTAVTLASLNFKPFAAERQRA